MIPILFDHYETDFTTNGVGRLDECVSCTVTEVVNGEYELEFEYPTSGKLFQRMVNYGGIVCATHDHNGDIQPFDIYAYEAPINGVVTFYAHHISYRLSNLIVVGTGTPPVALGGAEPSQIFDQIPVRAATENQFTFKDFSGYTPQTGRNFAVAGAVSVRDAFFNTNRQDARIGTHCLLDVFPGEFVFDGFNVFFYQRRGSNKGVQIRYGKNMTEVTRERNYGDIISSVFPIWCGNTDDAPTGTVVVGNQVFSPNSEINYAEWNSPTETMLTPDGEVYYFGAGDTRAAVVDFSRQFQSEPTTAQLEQAALEWMASKSSWKAIDNITVELADLYNTPEFAEYAELAMCQLGDYVDIYYPALGIVSEGIEIVSLVYDTLNDKVTEMQLGEIKTTYAQVLEKAMQGGNNA